MSVTSTCRTRCALPLRLRYALRLACGPTSGLRLAILDAQGPVAGLLSDPSLTGLGCAGDRVHEPHALAKLRVRGVRVGHAQDDYAPARDGAAKSARHHVIQKQAAGGLSELVRSSRGGHLSSHCNLCMPVCLSPKATNPDNEQPRL